jgi:hypothetical protein
LPVFSVTAGLFLLSLITRALLSFSPPSTLLGRAMVQTSLRLGMHATLARKLQRG